MAITINVNGVPIQYPQTGDTGWGSNATKFAEEVSAVLGKIGQSQAPVNDDIIVSPGNLSVTSGNLSVGGNASVAGTTSLTGNVTLTNNLTVNGNTALGDASGDSLTINSNGVSIPNGLNFDSNTLVIDATNNRIGINDSTPSEALDITGNALISGTLGVTGATSLSSTLGVTGDVAINTNKFNVTASSGNTTIAGTLGVTGNTTVDGVIYADDDTTANTPVVSFTGDTNTGIGRSAADTLDFITNGNSRFRIESTGQIKAVYESQVGTDYNTQLDNGYLCRAWVNFNGTGTVAIRASGNVSSITDNGTGDYTVNFTTAMPDANYSALYTARTEGAAIFVNEVNPSVPAKNTNSLRIVTFNTSFSSADASQINVGIFR